MIVNLEEFFQLLDSSSISTDGLQLMHSGFKEFQRCFLLFVLLSICLLATKYLVHVLMDKTLLFIDVLDICSVICL